MDGKIITLIEKLSETIQSLSDEIVELKNYSKYQQEEIERLNKIARNIKTI